LVPTGKKTKNKKRGKQLFFKKYAPDWLPERLILSLTRSLCPGWLLRALALKHTRWYSNSKPTHHTHGTMPNT
jgi:hypothetical protein